MNRLSIFGFFVLVAIIIFFSLLYLQPSPVTDTATVIDCSASFDTACVARELNHEIRDCEPWSADVQTCTKIFNLPLTVAYLSDSTNYVPGPVTDQNFSVEYLSASPHGNWDLEFIPDGSMLITSVDGTLTHYSSGTEMIVTHELPILTTKMTGLMGLAVDPTFMENHYIYLVYSYAYDTNNDPVRTDRDVFTRILLRISRATLIEDRLTDEKVLLDALPGSMQHAGGRIEIGSDGKLYVTTGAPAGRTGSQDILSYEGKILRLNTDGSVPEDNPYPDNYVYSYGHRNPQGLAWLAGSLFAAEHGPWRFDEINHIVPGENYGWAGGYKCSNHETYDSAMDGEKFYDLDPSQYIQPISCTTTWTLAPSGMTAVDMPDHPWSGSIFVAGLRGGHIRRYLLDENGALSREEVFYFRSEEDAAHTKISRRFRDVEFFNGSLYVLGDFYGIAKLTPR